MSWSYLIKLIKLKMKKDFLSFLEDISNFDIFLKITFFTLFIAIPVIALNKISAYLGIPVSLLSNLDNILAILTFLFLYVIAIFGISFMLFLSIYTFDYVKKEIIQKYKNLNSTSLILVMIILTLIVFSLILKSVPESLIWLKNTLILILAILVILLVRVVLWEPQQLMFLFTFIFSLCIFIIYIISFLGLPLIIGLLIWLFFGFNGIFPLLLLILILGILFYLLKYHNPFNNPNENLNYFYLSVYLIIIIIITLTFFAKNENLFEIFRNFYFDKKIVLLITKNTTNSTKIYKGWLINIYNNFIIFRTKNKTLIIPKGNIKLLETLEEKN